MRTSLLFITVFYLALQLLFSVGCKHDPLIDPFEPPPPPDTTGVDSTDTIPPGMPCDPDKVYFDLQVLPILNSNCAISGCHDPIAAEEGVILTSYQTVIATGKVTPFNLDESKLYKVLIDTDPEDRMPLDRPPLSQEQIQLIAAWILQGADSLWCDVNAGGCDTASVSFAQHIWPVINSSCKGCHSGTNPSGGIDLSNYTGVKAVALNGKLLGAINWEQGFTPMPQGGNKLPDCTIAQVKKWIEEGAMDN
ncbi:MAG: hypothetical protein CMN32_05670 [Saprospirales bacterium]|nr:hypothetical protein [Saprospirales bacterium]